MAARMQRAKRVRSVDVNAATGSLLVTFSADDPIDAILDELRLAGFDIASAFDRRLVSVQTQSHAAAAVERVMSGANARLHLGTGGHIDLRFAVPAIYMLLGVRSFLRGNGRLRDATWYQLMYWAFDSFFKLHEGATVRQDVTRGGSVRD